MHVRVIIDATATDLPPEGAVVRVYVEDTSRMDQAARSVAQSTVRVDKLIPPIPVEITCREPAANESFTVRVHVDASGSGQVEVGDLVSTAAHRAINGEVQVPVRRVG